MLAVLRLALGWHFLYEGIWKIRHADLFVGETEGFLSGARGPLAGIFYGMLPDIDGHRRLEDNFNLTEADGNDTKENPAKPLKLAKSWDDLRQRFVDFYRPADGKDDAKRLHEQLVKEAEKVYDRHVQGLTEFVKQNGEKIKAHFESLKRYEEGLKSDPRTMFQRQRRWDEMQDLRKEAKGWIADLESRENALKGQLLALLSKDCKAEVEAVLTADKEEAGKEAKKKKTDEKKADAKAATKSSNKAADKSTEAAGATVIVVDFSPLAENHAASGPFAPSSNPFAWKWIEQLAFLLTWSLFGIGLCLMLGLFTRPAALAGAGFMLFVVMSQPSYPGVYPLDPPQLGHALLVNKDFVEMIALLVIASTSLGRWTGLDFFIHRFLIKPFCKCCNGTTTEGRKA
jgi:uncharacterized membrane protein YphA (DoxX/SURF4 family)